MKILMATNTYLNVVGGLEKSVQSFARKFRDLGHEVLIAGPDFVGQELGQDQPKRKKNQSKEDSHPLQKAPFSLSLPFRGKLERKIAAFNPDIVHAHHPFLMGEMALRFSAYYGKPVVFTYHILFNEYAHYLPSVSSRFSKVFLVTLAAGFCNLVSRVIAPSESVREVLRGQGVQTQLEVVPTGIEYAQFSKGNRDKKRQELGLSDQAVLLGYVGRLAPEKNLNFLMENVLRFMDENKEAHFLVAGKGPSENELKQRLESSGLSDRFHFMGALQGQELIDCYHALDIFVFTSKSETQGLVLCEAMAAGVPVVAIDAPGVREVIQDLKNGRLVAHENHEEFQMALSWCMTQSESQLNQIRHNAQETAKAFSMDLCAAKALEVYREVQKDFSSRQWGLVNRIVRCFKIELMILSNFVRSLACALSALISPQFFEQEKRV